MNHNDLSQCRVDTDRLLIAPFTAADADDVYQAITPTLTRFMTFEPEASPEDFANVWQSWLPLMREGEEVIFVARRREDRQFVGVGGAHNLRSHTPELGIWVKESLHGQGYGREIVQGIARWASERFQPPHFLYPVAEQNTASRRLVESLGGVLAGRCERIKYDAVVYHLPPQR
ncbi:TPA: GNAT family N-acetyltransferase [Serratia marcescens]|uniref:GNAT family N-acetyltransferase n=1 Tax=Serratia TaxID=613 RepID=UPI000666E940|nr:GNAT family N-acetyltransferase [Serratia marcescens]AXX18043.1 N-acetyltransferase [Serratia marcescens]AXX24539.1 N-acetyltransferase [Serratia marcescens]MBI6122665.1 GNAT family N-acetyltransferase [Serratia marcescens]MDI3445766.1 GNAT family N-acetyltransferase [Serratia marcescens]MDP8859031.1 GNAT family N-acetyltransferase [Serratia marcescens]